MNNGWYNQVLFQTRHTSRLLTSTLLQRVLLLFSFHCICPGAGTVLGGGTGTALGASGNSATAAVTLTPGSVQNNVLVCFAKDGTTFANTGQTIDVTFSFVQDGYCEGSRVALGRNSGSWKRLGSLGECAEHAMTDSRCDGSGYFDGQPHEAGFECTCVTSGGPCMPSSKTSGLWKIYLVPGK